MQVPITRYSQSTIRPKSFFITPIDYSEPSNHHLPIQSRPSHRYSNSLDFAQKSFELVNQFQVPSQVRMVVSSILKKPSPVEKQKIIERIEKNKDLAVMSKHTKIELARLKAFQSNVRAGVTKIAKKTIYEHKRSHRQNMLKDKFQSLQYRLNIVVLSI